MILQNLARYLQAMKQLIQKTIMLIKISMMQVEDMTLLFGKKCMWMALKNM
jgi:hypothetical protein